MRQDWAADTIGSLRKTLQDAILLLSEEWKKERQAEKYDERVESSCIDDEIVVIAGI